MNGIFYKFYLFGLSLKLAQLQRTVNGGWSSDRGAPDKMKVPSLSPITSWLLFLFGPSKKLIENVSRVCVCDET